MKKKKPFLGEMLKKIAPKIGAKVIIEPNWNYAGQIVFKNGKKRYFLGTCLDLNTLGSSEIAKDKSYANFFMEKLGYPVVPMSKTFYSDKWAEAIGDSKNKIESGYKHALSIGFPVLVKPNSKSQGKGVCFVHNKKEFYSAVYEIFKEDKVAIVQKIVRGRDYRIVVLDNEVISVYERIPLFVKGDGKSNIEKLLEEKQKYFEKIKRDTKINIKDERIKNKLFHLGLNMKSIPKKGEEVFLLDNSNLSNGGESLDKTEEAHLLFKKIAIKLTKDMGLRFCGVDIMTEGNINEKPQKFWILEINASPGLDHYAASGDKQKKIVEDLYLKVLKSIGK